MGLPNQTLPQEPAFSPGIVTGYSADTALHHVAYDDGDAADVDLTSEQWYPEGEQPPD